MIKILFQRVDVLLKSLGNIENINLIEYRIKYNDSL